MGATTPKDERPAEVLLRGIEAGHREALFQTLAANIFGEAPDPDSYLSDSETRMIEETLFGVAIWVGAWIGSYDGPGHSAHPTVMATEWLKDLGFTPTGEEQVPD